MQPIAAEDVAETVARIAQQPPANGVLEIAGPQRSAMADLARQYLQLTVIPGRSLRMPRRCTSARRCRSTRWYRSGSWLGQVDFEAWLQQSGLLQRKPA